MVKPSQLRRLATSPTDFLRFRASGQLPRQVRPGGPLVILYAFFVEHYVSAMTGAVKE